MSANVYYTAKTKRVWVNGAFLVEGCPYLASRMDGIWCTLEIGARKPAGGAEDSSRARLHVSVGGTRVYTLHLTVSGPYNVSTKGGSLITLSDSYVKNTMDAFGIPRSVCRAIDECVDTWRMPVYHKYPAKPNSAGYSWFETDGTVTLSTDGQQHAAEAVITEFNYIVILRIGVGPSGSQNHVRTVIHCNDSIQTADKIANTLFKYLTRR